MLTLAIDRFIAGKSLPKSPCKRIPTGIPAVLGAPKSFDSLRVSGGLPRKIGRTVSALGATLDDLRLVVSPAALATSGGGLRGGSWAIDGNKLVLRHYEAVTGVTLERRRSCRITAARSGAKAASGTSPCAPAGACPGRSAGGGSRCGRRAQCHRGAASKALELAR